MEKSSADVTGLDLDIDPAIQEICKTSNASSSGTRSVLYIMVIVNILAFAVIINTYRLNWSDLRQNKLQKDINGIKAMLLESRAILREHLLAYREAGNKRVYDSMKLIAGSDSDRMEMLRDSLRVLNEEMALKKRNNLENYDTVKMPILGNSVDVNNIGILAGVCFFFLLLIVRFTQFRERANLIIALNSITKRYPDNANQELFANYLARRPLELRDELLKQINYTRRQHHYNFLSMNEIFNLPPLAIKKNLVQETIRHQDMTASAVSKFSDRIKFLPSVEKLVMNLFWFPFLVYLLIFLNDITTVDKAWVVSPGYTVFGILLETLFIITIGYFSLLCTAQKKMVNSLYKNFMDNDYKY